MTNKQIKKCFLSYDNKTAITAFEENPFAIIIESADLAKSMRTIFNIAWLSGRELKNNPK